MEKDFAVILIDCYDDLSKINVDISLNGESEMMDEGKETNIATNFGFKFDRNGAHSARTIMLDEMELLLSREPQINANKEDFYVKIVDENCLEKRSNKSRTLTYRHLIDL